MAIVKILKSSKSFSAVQYNEDRCSKGEARLIAERNFNSSGILMSHTDYLKLWSEKNKRIKNSQFHVTISLKENEMTEKELLQLADNWMKEMGYGDNPYLVYFHTNTEHPHVHIISSRIDKNGNKINDSFEKERAVQCLNKLLGLNKKNENRKTISDLLHYSFSTKYQFIELCKQSGFKVTIKDDHIVCKKGDTRINLSNELINFCISRYHRDVESKEKKRIQGLIYKYAALLSKDRFSSFMREHFGLQFIFYGKQGDINGYTIIDNKNKCVYKGSEIFGAKKISELLDIKQSPVVDIILQIDDYLKEHPLCTSSDINDNVLINSIYRIKGDKIVCYADNSSYEIETNMLQKIKYNNRLNYFFVKFNPYNEKTAKLIARLGDVKWQDLMKLSKPDNIDDSILQKYNLIIKEALDNKMSVVDKLKSLNLTLTVDGNSYYILDPTNKIVICGDDLDISRENLLDNIREYNKSSFDLSDFEDFNRTVDEDFNIFDLPMFDFAGLLYVGHFGGAKSNRKRKRN